MKLLIASDIHGSSYYIKKLEQLNLQEQPDNIIILGDILSNNNAEDDEIVINTLNKYSNKIIAVAGNCDNSYTKLRMNFALSDSYQKINIDGQNFYLSHGHLNNKYDYLFQDNYLLSGHTHVPILQGKHLNPGSVGLPRQNTKHTCLLYCTPAFLLIDLDSMQIIDQKRIN